MAEEVYKSTGITLLLTLWFDAAGLFYISDG